MKVSRNYLNKPHRIYGGANILKGGDIPGAFAPLGGAIFLGISPPFERGANLRGGDKSTVTTAWAKIYLAPPKKSLPLKCPPKF